MMTGQQHSIVLLTLELQVRSCNLLPYLLKAGRCLGTYQRHIAADML